MNYNTQSIKYDHEPIKIDPTKKIHEQITKETWCKEALFKDNRGRGTQKTSNNLCKACALGWLALVYGQPASNVAPLAIENRFKHALWRDINNSHWKRFPDIPDWNDSPLTQFEHVQRVFKDADL